MRPTCVGSPESAAGSSHPDSARRSRLTSNGFPAKAEVEEYGELPLAGGLSGNTCHSPWRASARKSENSWPAGPKSPKPPREGSEIGWDRIAVRRGEFMWGRLGTFESGLLHS